MKISPEQCRAARGLLNLSQSQVAESAHVSAATIAGFERHGKAPGFNNLQAIRAVLEAAGVAFLSGNDGGPGVRLRVSGNGEGAGETTISPHLCRAARAVAKLSQTGLAKAAGIARSTVADFERGARMPTPDNLAAMRTALEAASVEFIDPNGGGPGVRLRE